MRFALAIFALLLAGASMAQTQPQLYMPDIARSFNDGYRQGQERRQRELDYQAQLEQLQQQQRLRALSAEFWASDDARKWQLLPDIAAIDPDVAAQYQASIAPAVEPTRSVIYKCHTDDGSIVFTAIPAEGCTVISANPGQ